MSFSRKLEFVTSLKKNLFDASLIDFFFINVSVRNSLHVF
jgi:hypothetical protein